MGQSKMNNPDRLATMAIQDKKKQNKKEASNGLTEFLRLMTLPYLLCPAAFRKRMLKQKYSFYHKKNNFLIFL
jgi:hypothetical protein